MARRIIFKIDAIDTNATPPGFKSLGIDNNVFSEMDEFGVISPIGRSGGYQFYTEVVITSSEILTLNSAPVEVLPTLIGDKYYDLKVYFEYTFGTTPYTTVLPGLQGPRLINSYGNVVFGLPLLTASESIAKVETNNGASLGNINSNLRLSHSVGDLTGGDGTIKLKIFYNIVNFG